MPVIPEGYDRPAVHIVPFSGELNTIYSPRDEVSIAKNSPQIQYIARYAERLGCKTLVVEDHYIDRDYVDDFAEFYARNLRKYANSCKRIHFFALPFDRKTWRRHVTSTNQRIESMALLQESYLGFSVVRPLPQAPVGRTVLVPPDSRTSRGLCREFLDSRGYEVHLGGFQFIVDGVAFQQQDAAVSACATAALWSSMQSVSLREGKSPPTPAQITETASRYLLVGGRPLPSEGLTPEQMCEAIRAAGFAPVVVEGLSVDQLKAHILGYLNSGLTPVLGIEALDTGLGHAVACVGVKLNSPIGSGDPSIHYRDAASAVSGLYLHDDRLGPYSAADLYPYTTDRGIRPAIRIRWQGEDVEFEHSVVSILLAAVPDKIRLSISKMRELALVLAESLALLFPRLSRVITVASRYELASSYCSHVPEFRLSANGRYHLLSSIPMSRHVGVISLISDDGPFCDVLLDATESGTNPGALVLVLRGDVARDELVTMQTLAASLPAAFIA